MANSFKTITISSSVQLHLAMSHICETRGISHSLLVRKALQRADAGVITKANANLAGGGFYRTVVNISGSEAELLDQYRESTKLSKSAIIRAAVTGFLQTLVS